MIRHVKRAMTAALLACAMHADAAAAAAEVARDDPMSYDMRQYGFILGIALFGGLVGHHRKVKKGDVKASDLRALIGELSISAFAGLLAFWLCRYAGVPPLLEAATVGMAGHLGTKALDWAEELLRKRADRLVGNDKP